jgi:glutamine synthetase
VYGPDNHLRLTGLHETQAIDKFSYGLSDRGASIRMPVNFIKNGYKGYLEDRRPNSEGDPYQIVSRILKTINSVPKLEILSQSVLENLVVRRGSGKQSHRRAELQVVGIAEDLFDGAALNLIYQQAALY